MIIVINLGLKSIRAIVFDFEGRNICSSSLPVATALSGPKVEQDADEWWKKLVAVVRNVTAYPGVSDGIELVTVSCSSSCVVAVDEAVRPLAPAIIVSDRRAGIEAEEIAALEPFKALSEKYSLLCNIFCQPARLVWLKKNQPEIYAKAAKFLSPNDYLLAKLSGGRFVTDELNAEKLWYLLDEKRYPDEIYRAAGLDVTKLPEVLPPGSEIGRLAPDMSATLRINPRARLYLGTYDAICSIFGTGVNEKGMICDVSGTVTSVRMCWDEPFNDPKGRIFCQYFSPSKDYFVGGSNNLGGGLVEWAKQCFYRNQEHPYEIMEKEARASVPALNGIVFLPHLLGARAPSWNSDARGVFFGIERHHSRGDLMRSLFESIGFSIREFVDIFREVGKEIKLVTASGGLARISLVNELKANITQLPYHVMDEFESTCLGAAIIALVASGHYKSYAEACQCIVRTKQIFLPSIKHRGYYDDMYGLYKDVGAASEELFSKRLKLLSAYTAPAIDRIENL